MLSNNNSDGESHGDIQRKKEIILARQLERRQQQELIRLKREEEKARKAEEIRLKEEELNNKKMLEKTRKETIYQAYIDKKKQLEEESQCGSFGPPNSLLNAKKFHSTNRLKASKHQQQNNNNNNNYASNLEQQQFKQNMIDQFDQVSIFSDRSSNNNQYAQSGMIKSKSCFFFFNFFSRFVSFLQNKIIFSILLSFFLSLNFLIFHVFSKN
jgi:hypothetical protein